MRTPCSKPNHRFRSKPNVRPTQLRTGKLRLSKDHPSYSPTYIANLAAIIARDGIKAPILIDERRVIHSGMALYLAALHLGFEFVPVVWLDPRPPKQLQFRRAAL